MASVVYAPSRWASSRGPQSKGQAMPTGVQETLTFVGRSGAKYLFHVYPWGTEFKAVGGVYSILRHDADGYAVIYVGQTRDLSERFDDHHKEECFSRNRKTHLAAMVEESERQRLMIEQDLIASYNPSCNGCVDEGEG